MRILYSSGFLRSFGKLTVKIQDEFRQREVLFRQNPFDPVLKTHKLKNRSDWAFLITYEIRVIFIFKKDEFKFLDIGDHSIYRKK
jgi:mRNA-degrading endonuclease YafQ of YafQ-DinJ toxin-antitoxin module